MIGYVMLNGPRRIAVLLAAGLFAGPAGPALADPRPVSTKDQKLASELVKKAIAMSQAGDHDAAIKLYKDAYLIAPNSLLLSNIGAQYQEIGQWGNALEYFCRYLKEDPSGTNAPFARSQAKLVQYQLDRKKVGSKDPCATPPDDESTDRTRTIEDQTRTIDDKGKASGNPVLTYSGLAAGIAGAAVAGISLYYGIQGKNLSDQASAIMPPWDPDKVHKLNELNSEGQHDNRLQVGFLVASGVLVTTGVVLYMVGRPDANERASDKTVHVTPTTNGFAVFGRF
jgi:tetratricopeptide (TPR) repeat protein